MFADLGPALGPFESVERLRILETLSYGVLYEGRLFQASRAQDIWLVELDPVFQRDSKILGSVLVELLAAAKLRDSSIVSPRGIFRHGDNLYLLLDSYTGVGLSTAFEFLGRTGLRLSPEAVLRIAGGVLTALDVAARPDSGEEAADNCHGLLTPENIFVAEGQRVLVRGFGIWKAGIQDLGLLGPTERRYLAPSQNRKGTASARNDLLALGTILFEAVVGFPAFDSPPEEEDLAELRGSVGELQSKAEPSLWDLFEVVLACLTPPSRMTPAYRARVRKTVDTLFLREFSRDRDPKILSLEDLLGRVKPRRPAIVKATSLSLTPAEANPPSPNVETPESNASEAREAKPEDVSNVSTQPAPPEVEPPLAQPQAAIPSMFAAARPRREQISVRTWVFASAAGIAVALLITIALSSWPKLEHLAVARAPSPRFERPSMLLSPSAVEQIATPIVAIPTPMPLPSPAEAEAAAVASAAPERRPTPRLSPRPRRMASAKQPLRRRQIPQRTQESLGETAPFPADSSSGRVSQGSVPVVAPGTLVAWSTPGLVPPVLLQQPPAPRYEQSDPRPASERIAQLEILVSDSGRVRGSRIVRADRMPPGFVGGVERYLSAMHFRPAEVGGVPVKVWMPYQLKYYAP